MTGWIKLHRSLLEWEWYDDINVKVTFLHLILSANHAPKKWRGIDIGRGQLWTSIGNLAKEIGLSEKQTRNSLKKLENTNEISIKGASNGTMITVCKYDSYQDFKEDDGKQTGKPKASKGRAMGEQWATNNNDNNDNNEKNEDKYTFIEFWNAYDKKSDKAACESKWSKLKDGDKKLIMQHVPNYVKQTPDKKYRKNPLTYLNKKTWLDYTDQDGKLNEEMFDDTAGDLEDGWRFVPMSEAYEIVRDLSFTSMHEAELRGEGDEYVRKVMNARVQYEAHGNAWKTRK